MSGTEVPVDLAMGTSSSLAAKRVRTGSVAVRPFDPGTVAAGFATWLVKRRFGPFKRRMREIEKTQWYSEAELQGLQVQRLHHVLEHCYESVPFYRRSFKSAQFDPHAFNKLEDLEGVPVLNKAEVLENSRDFVSRSCNRWLLRKAHTGGTTGTPLALYRDWQSIGNEHAFVRRQWSWAGLQLRDACAYLTGRLVVPPDEVRGRLYRYDPILKELFLSTYHLSPQAAPQYINAIREFRAKGLVAYPSAALMLAREILERRQKVPLSAVLTSSETLADEAKRTIAEAFCCPVFDFYGAAERVCYIMTCERGAYHIISDYGYTELMPVEGALEEFTVVATGFWNMAMPLVRYHLQDLVQITGKKCSCGRAFPVVDRIIGRPQGRILTPCGRCLGSAVLTHLLYGVTNVIESQLIQDSLDHCYLKYVKAPGFSETDKARLWTLVATHLPSTLTVELREVESIERSPSGKLLPVISELV